MLKQTTVRSITMDSSSPLHRRTTWHSALACVIGLGCGPSAGHGSGADETGGAEGGQSDSGTERTGDTTGGPVDAHPELDLLFIVDDSVSTKTMMRKFAESREALADALLGLNADIRVGFSTTSVSGPLCPAPQRDGALFATTCRDRLDDFRIPGGSTDATEAQHVCTDACAEKWTVATPLPSPKGDRVHPWIEVSPDSTNLPSDMSLSDALGCFGLQGLRGCNYPSHLEALRAALDRFADPDDVAAGFRRPGSIFVAVFVSHKYDCSLNPEWGEAFDTPQFWVDQDRGPTLGMCWNAGVECVGTGSPFDACGPIDRSEDGGLAADGASAVLWPVSRYSAAIQALGPGTKVYGVLGVPSGFEAGETPEYWAPDPNDTTEVDFGVAQVCDDPSTFPPVRMRVVISESGGRLLSVCENDFVGVFHELVEDINADLSGA